MSGRLVFWLKVKFVCFPWKTSYKATRIMYNISCFVNGSLVTEVLPLSGVLTFLKATNSPGLQTRIIDLWTCTQGAGGPLHAVFFVRNVCTELPTSAEGVVVLVLEMNETKYLYL